jgi:hypothetical protein
MYVPYTPFRSLSAGVFALVGLLAGCSDVSAWTGEIPGRRPSPPPVAFGLEPARVVGGQRFTLVVEGRFARGDLVLLDGVAQETAFLDEGHLALDAAPRARGAVTVEVARGEWRSAPLTLEVRNGSPTLSLADRVSVAEGHTLVLDLGGTDPDGDVLRFGALDLPPGARLDPATGVLTFRPDFIQGGRSYVSTLLVDDGTVRVERDLRIDVEDTIQVPAPRVEGPFERRTHRRYELEQITDAYLDSPGYAGRRFEAVVTVPRGASADAPVPVRVHLHGFGAARPSRNGSAREIHVAPHDPDNTYWWGYSDALPDAPAALGTAAPPYTARRVLALLEWTLENVEGADPERVYVSGSSMGGAGAAVVGLLWARHFAWVDGRLGQTVARNHRPARVRQLATLWGAPTEALDGGGGVSAWDRMDLTRVLLEEWEARNQFIHTRHGKDDTTIHFGAAVDPSPLSGISFYDVLQAEGIGHYAIWDEGGHGAADPVLGQRWWERDRWEPMFDAAGGLRRDRAFVAFSAASSDRDPGTGGGNGNRARSASRGYANRVAVAGDTGWDGEVAGVLNRFLRWDSTGLVDDFDRFEIPVTVSTGEGREASRAGYPTVGDRFDGVLPVTVDLTPRRTQAFRPAPGERIGWELGEQHGEVRASPDGSVTVAGVELTDAWQLLHLERAGASR